MSILKRLLQDTSGTTPIEYGLICFLIVVPIIVYTQDIGQKVLGFFTSAAAAF